MDENIGFFPNAVYELVSFLKVFGQIFGRVIINWNVEVVCNLFLSMLDNTSLYCSHNSLDSQFWVDYAVRLSSWPFWAAFKFEIKIPPTPATPSNTQLISSLITRQANIFLSTTKIKTNKKSIPVLRPIALVSLSFMHFGRFFCLHRPPNKF